MEKMPSHMPGQDSYENGGSGAPVSEKVVQTLFSGIHRLGLDPFGGHSD